MIFNIPYQHRNSSGIYAIVNIETEEVYIGGTSHLKKRYDQHLFFLQKNEHHSSKLQHSYNKHGADSFSFSFIETCKSDDLIEREQYWINSFDATNKGYNICPTAGTTKGRILSDEHKRGISKSNTGKKHSEEVRKKMSVSRAGKPGWHRGKKRSLEARFNNSVAQRGKKLSEETRGKISAARTGHKLSEETKKKLSEAALKREAAKRLLKGQE